MNFPVSVQHLSREASVHAPLLLRLLEQKTIKPRFIFFKMWTMHEGFQDVVARCWHLSPLATSQLTTLWLKLNAMKSMLKKLNKEVFGHIHFYICKSEDCVLAAEHLYDTNPTPQHFADLECARSELSNRLLQEESFWCQKSRIRWLKEGDRNTKFFHSIAIARRRKNHISHLVDHDGNDITDQQGMKDIVVAHFMQAFSSQPHCIEDGILDCILHIVTPTENYSLSSVPSASDIKEAVFAMSADSAPGPDGFSGQILPIHLADHGRHCHKSDLGVLFY